MGRCERHHSLACVAVVQLHRLPIRTRDRRLSGDLAYLVGFDHLANSVNDVQVEPYTLREMVHRARRAACASTAYVCVVDRDFRVGVGVGAAAWLPVWLPIGPIHYESPAQGSRTVSLSATACAGIRR
jgi:hypothetical protein